MISQWNQWIRIFAPSGTLRGLSQPRGHFPHAPMWLQSEAIDAVQRLQHLGLTA
jgi:hypothetical protein